MTDPGAPGSTLLQAFSYAQRPSEAVLLKILVSLLEAIQALHQAGTVHGGLGPDTVSLDAAGNGILAAPSEVNPLLAVAGRSGHLKVTPGYSPLEAYRSGPPELNPASDLYAFGAIAFWLMTGEHPAEAPARALDDQLPVLSGRADLEHYSRELREAVDTCLWLAPADRPQRAATLAATLKQLQANLAAREAPLACPVFVPDPHRLAKVREALNNHLLPPVVSALLGHAQRKSGNWQEFCELVAGHIDDANARQQFLTRFSAMPASGTPTVDEHRFSPDLLAALEAELKQDLGAVARIVIRRAAAKAADRSALYQAVAAELDNPVLAQRFLAWANSSLGT